MEDLRQMQRMWRPLNAMLGETSRTIVRLEMFRAAMMAATDELASALDRRIGPYYRKLEEEEFCPECNSGPGEEHGMHCSIAHGPELEAER